MSELRCLKCGLKFDYSDNMDYRLLSKKEFKQYKTEIQDSNYNYVICEYCIKKGLK